MEVISIFATSIEDVSPVDKTSIEVVLADVDIPQLISEVGTTELLNEISIEEIKEYLINKQSEGNESE